MKKQALFLIAGSMLAFAACNSNTQSGPTQAQIDSMANAKAAEMQAQKAAQNDSIINAMAKMKADSIEAAQKMAAGARTTTKTHTTTHTTTKTETTTVKPGSLGDRPGASSSSTNTNTNTNSATDHKKGGLGDRPGATNTK